MGFIADEAGAPRHLPAYEFWTQIVLHKLWAAVAEHCATYA